MERFALKQISGGVFLTAMLLLAAGFARATSTSGCDGNGNCYIYASAAGTGTGASWTNAYTGFGTGTGQINPASMARGVTYWIAAGNYGKVAFSTADSGSSVITIEGATTASHGPDSTWSNSYAGQALFADTTDTGSAAATISTDYWTFNGQPVPGCSYPNPTDSCYSIHFWNENDFNNSAAAVTLYPSSGGAGDHVTLEYVEIEGTGMTGGAYPNNTTTESSSYSSGDDSGILSNGAGPNYFYVGYSYIHHTGTGPTQMNSGLSNYQTYEYDWFAYNHTAQDGTHDECFSNLTSNWIIRYSVFQDISWNGIMVDPSGASSPSQNPLSNWYFYGNIVYWDATYAAYAGKYGGAATFNNAVVNFLGEEMSGVIYVTNNTIYGIHNSLANTEGYGYSTEMLGGVNSSWNTGSPTVIVENNLWYQCDWVTPNSDYEWYCSANANATCTYNYNASYVGSAYSGDDWQTGISGSSPLIPPGANDYNVSSSSATPFSNATAYTIAGFDLTTPDPFSSYPGATLSSSLPSGCTSGVNCLNSAGLTGNLFGANGTWDRGAEQLGSSAAPSPPTNLTATPH